MWLPVAARGRPSCTPVQDLLIAAFVILVYLAIGDGKILTPLRSSGIVATRYHQGRARLPMGVLQRKRRGCRTPQVKKNRFQAFRQSTLPAPLARQFQGLEARHVAGQ